MANISMANDKQLVQTNRQTASEIKIFFGAETLHKLRLNIPKSVPRVVCVILYLLLMELQIREAALEGARKGTMHFRGTKLSLAKMSPNWDSRKIYGALILRPLK